MSNKFTGITSAGSAIPVYDKDAHSALEQKLDTTAFSSVSGEFATVDDVVAAVSGKADTSAIPSLDGYATEEWVGEQGYLTEVPESAVSGFATHEEVESATSGKADTSALSGYLTKASGDDLYVKNTPYEVTAGPTDGSGGNPIFRVNPGGLYVGNSGYKVMSATNNSFTVGDPTRMKFSASDQAGMYFSANAVEISAYGNLGVKVPGDVGISGGGYALSATDNGINFSSVSGNIDVTTGISFSSNNPYLGSAALTTANGNQVVQAFSPKFEARNASGVGFSIEASGAKGYDHNGNVVWDTGKSVANSIISFAGTQPAILISPTPASQSGYAPYLSAGYQELAINYNNGPSAKMSLDGFSIKNGNNQASVSYQGIYVTGTDVNVYVPETSSSYTLRNSIQKSMIEGDSATSAITAIAGSAIGGGGGSTYSAGANIDITDDVISGRDWSEDIAGATSGLQPSGDYYSATNPSGFMTELPASATEAIDTVTANSGTWGGSALPISAGPGIKVDLVDNTLVFSNDETVLWSGGNLAIGSTATLSETVKNFELFGVYGHETNRGRGVYQEFNPAVVANANTQNFALFLPDCAPDMSWAGWYLENLYFTDTAATALVNVSGRQTWRWYANNTWEDGGAERYIQVDKVVGINRISGGN